MDGEEKTRNKKSEGVMSEVARGVRKRKIATGEAEEVKVERTRGSSERETEEVEELASNSRLLDRNQQRRRNFDERGERGFERNDRNYEGGRGGGQRREDHREDEGGHRGWQGGRADRGESNREASGWERDSLQQPFDLEAEEKR